MVQIFVRNNSGFQIAYEVSLHDPVSLLKASIEETEGKPVVQQRLLYQENQLQDSDTLGSYEISEGAVVRLSETPSFSVFIKALTGKTLTFQVALNDTLLVLQDLIFYKERIPHDQQRLIYNGLELDPSKTFSFYEIGKEAMLHLTLRLRGGGTGPDARAYAVVCYDWDGNMKHRGTQGLSLIRRTVVVITEKFDKNWYRGRNPGEEGGEAFIPYNFVRIFRYLDNKFRRFDSDSILSKLFPTRNFNIGAPPSNSILSRVIFRILLPTSPPSGPAQSSNEKDDIAALGHIPLVDELGKPRGIPPLPLLRFPEPDTTIFDLPLGEKGHSHIEISLQYDSTALPDQPTEVHVIAKCIAVGTRRISSLSLQITVRNNKVDNVKPEEVLGPMRETDVGVTRRKQTHLYGGVEAALGGVGGLNTGIERTSETEEVEKGIHFSQMQIAGHTVGHFTAQWLMNEAKTANSGDGLPAKIPGLSFRLVEKPREFKYDCYVISVVDGKEKPHHGIL